MTLQQEALRTSMEAFIKLAGQYRHDRTMYKAFRSLGDLCALALPMKHRLTREELETLLCTPIAPEDAP